MFWFRQHEYKSITRKTASRLAPALGFVIIILAAGAGNAQSTPSNPQPFSFRAGQSMYIVAFHHVPFPVILNGPDTGRQREFIDYDLDAERKVRKEIEEWHFFKVADKPSQADFIFLVSFDENSIEGLAVPFEAYRRHFKERFDLDALREAAFGRYLVGPLKVPTLGRLTDRLVKQFREKTK